MTTPNHSEWPLERISEVLEYCGKATPGPWTSVHENHQCLISAGVHGGGASTIRLVSSTEATKAIRENANNDADFIARTRTDLPSAVREIQRLRGLFLQIMIGGNHLATHLIGSSSKLPNDFKSYEEARDEEGMAYADCWVAWRKIMDARDALGAAKDPAK